MILTNDGELANRLAHPRYGVEKLYFCALIAGALTVRSWPSLTAGIWLSDGKVRRQAGPPRGSSGSG